ncbi:hypothetical protein [Paludisphaera rhizosphaerae]|nr:hypothetical protein [Paludisphaera rhizosphaerae]
MHQTPGLTFDQYLATLRQLSRSKGGISIMAMLRARELGDQARTLLPVAERLADFLTESQRRALGRDRWPEAEFLAAGTGTRLEVMEALIADFDATLELVDRWCRLRPLARLRLLFRNDPVVESVKRHGLWGSFRRMFSRQVRRMRP